MLKWSERVRIGSRAEEGYSKARKKLDAGEKVKGVWLVTKPSIPGNLFDIVQSDYLAQKQLYDALPEICGIAGSKEEAVELAAEMVKEILQ